MKLGTMAWVVGGTFVLAVGAMGAVACSSSNDNGGNPTTTGKDGGSSSSSGGSSGGSGSGSGSSSGSSSGSGSGSGSSSGGTDGGTADCGTEATLHPGTADAGPYCPFSAVGDAGNLTCDYGQWCCEPPQGGGASTCAANCAGLADGGASWQCDDTTSCGAGQICCANTTGAGQDPGCTTHFLHKFTGTVCVTGTACNAGQIQVCEQATGQCPTGTTCSPTKAHGGQFGLCL